MHLEGFRRRTGRRLAHFFRLSTSCPPRGSLHHSFLSLVDGLPAAPLARSLLSFACRRLARLAAHLIARFFRLSTACPPRRSPGPCRTVPTVRCAYLQWQRGRIHVMLAWRGIVEKATGCLLNDWVSAVLSHPERRQPHQKLISVGLERSSFPRSLDRSFQPLARCAAGEIERFFHLSMSCPPCCSLLRSFVPLVDVLPTAPLTALQVSFTRRRLIFCAAR